MTLAATRDARVAYTLPRDSYVSIAVCACWPTTIYRYFSVGGLHLFICYSDDCGWAQFDATCSIVPFVVSPLRSDLRCRLLCVRYVGRYTYGSILIRR